MEDEEREQPETPKGPVHDPDVAPPNMEWIYPGLPADDTDPYDPAPLSYISVIRLTTSLTRLIAYIHQVGNYHIRTRVAVLRRLGIQLGDMEQAVQDTLNNTEYLNNARDAEIVL